MKNSLLLVALVVLIALGAWWLARSSRSTAAAASMPARSAPERSPAEDPGELTSSLEAVPREAVAKESDSLPPAESTEAPAAGASEALPAPTEEEALWMAQFGESSKEELRSLVEKFTPGMDEERDRLWADPEPSSSPEVVLAELDATLSQVEQRFAQLGTVTLARRLEPDEASQRARFELLHLPRDRAPEIASLQRQIAWLEARIASLGD